MLPDQKPPSIISISPCRQRSIFRQALLFSKRYRTPQTHRSIQQVANPLATTLYKIPNHQLARVTQLPQVYNVQNLYILELIYLFKPIPLLLT